jgi:ankyrin repeat protein
MEPLPHALIGEFIEAAACDARKAEAMLRQHPGLLNARWIHDETVLHFLAIEGFDEGVTFLASRGADVNAVNEFGDPALVDVCSLGLDVMVEILVQHGANPNASSATRDTALHAGIRSGNARIVGLLLQAGADPHYRTHLDECVFDAVEEAPARHQPALIAVLAEYGVLRQ